MTDYIGKLRKEINGSPDDYIILIETTPEKALDVNMALIKLLTEKNDKGIIVSANRPYQNLINFYKRNSIDVSKMYVLDCVSKNGNNGGPKIENATFIENASALTDISLCIDEHINGTPEKKFLFFDTLTTMLIHNKPQVFARFLHNILTKMRIKGVGGVLISLTDDSNKETRAEIAQLCDKVIKI